MALNEILFDISTDEKSAIQYLQQNKVLRTCALCQTCGRLMSLIKFGRGDQKAFRCPNHKTVKISLRSGSYFENSKLDYLQIVRLFYCWAYKFPIVTTVPLVGLCEPTVIHWHRLIRDICTHWLKKNPYRIGGPGLTVEIDESLITKRKYNRKGDKIEERWVFGGVCRETGQGFLILIPDKEAVTLLPLIQDNIAPGSIIYTARSPLYNNIDQLPVVPPYQQLVHDKIFVAPTKCESINTAEIYWENAKTHFKQYAGVPDSTLESHLEEFLWLELHGQSFEAAFNNILLHLSQWYPV